MSFFGSIIGESIKRKGEASLRELERINNRAREIRSLLKSGAEVDFDAIENELKDLEEQRERHLRAIQDFRNNDTAFASETRAIPGATMRFDGSDYKPMNDFENMKPEEVRATEEYRSAFFKTMQGRELNEVEKRAFTSAANSAGAAIPTTTYDEVLKRLRQSLALFPHITALQLPGNVTIPVETGEAGATWVDELTDIPETGNPIGSVKLGGFTLAKLIPVSIAAETMSASAFESYLTDIIVEKMSIEIEKAILNGSGTGQPTGILTGVTWTANTNSFNYATTGITYDDLLKPLAGLGSAYLPNAAWVMNSTTLYQQVAKVTGADGKLIFVPDATEGFAGKIMGKPVIVDDYMPADTILFGNFRYYFMNFSQPIAFEKSRESGFRKATVDYRAVAVLDGKPAMDEAFIKLEKSAT